MNKLTFNGEIIETELTIEEIRERLSVKKTGGRWKPESGQCYWRINDWGDAIESTPWGGERKDNFRYSIGNVFRTREEAEESLRTGVWAKRQALQRIEDWQAANCPFVPDWSDATQDKFEIGYSHGYGNSHLAVYSRTSVQTSPFPCFASRSEAQLAIEANRADYELLFGISKSRDASR